MKQAFHLFRQFVILVIICCVPSQRAWADHYVVVYDGRSYDSAANETTFSYTISGTGQPPALSHLTIELPLCTPALNVVTTNPTPVTLGNDPTTGLTGIKWDSGLDIDDTQTYSYTLSGNVQEGDVRLAVKAGQIREYTDTKGASCNTCVANEGDICSVGIGMCEANGTVLCDGTCSATPGNPDPGGEICSDNLDNDCDSSTDEPDDCDACPIDPTKSEPGQCGCGIPDTDSDNDQIADCKDNCPLDPLKVAPGACGCGVSDVDGDNDGTPNCTDQCPTDPRKVIPGACGCGVLDTDSDNDGTPDCTDQCPIDPLKVAPEACGCGVLDTDSDQDGTPDCRDLCPIDPKKTAAGACGCGVSDVDGDNDGTANCTDQCPVDPAKVSPGVCGCGIADTDSNSNGIIDCVDVPSDECSGLCFEALPNLDEDKDGVSNCAEIEDGTDPCDRGSVIERLSANACAGPNGFFDQVNILTVINHQINTTLKARVEYRDFHGALQSSNNITLRPEERKDLIVNDLGLEPDTYGTVCVFTDAAKAGVWSGGLSLYKERYDFNSNAPLKGLTPTTTFDYALYYPLTNPMTSKSTVILNTNSLGTTKIPSTMVANWVRLTDASPGDGKGLAGTIFYYNVDGKPVGTHKVALPDGGRFDFGGHELVGQRAVGLAEFVPKSNSSKYYLESSRYAYEGPFVVTGNFWTAYVIPNRKATGAPTIGKLSTMANELAIVELINASGAQITAPFTVFSGNGSTVMSKDLIIPPKGSRHIPITGNTLQAGFNGSAEVSGPPESVAGQTLVYRFGTSGGLLLAYAPPFLEQGGKKQRTQFNSFIGQSNSLEVTNSTDNAIVASVRIVNSDTTLLQTFQISLAARATKRFELSLPANRYGTIVVDSGNVAGLVVRNNVSRLTDYTISFPGK